jgi:transcriptional regulator with XRE-family HTH domain
MNQPREDWPRLGSYVISARKAAGFRTRRAFAAAIGVTDRTLAKLEGGERVGVDTLAAVAAGVGWTPDSPRRILARREPLLLSAVPPPLVPVPEQGAGRPDLVEDAAAALINATSAIIAQSGKSATMRWDEITDLVRAVERPEQGHNHAGGGLSA